MKQSEYEEFVWRARTIRDADAAEIKNRWYATIGPINKRHEAQIAALKKSHRDELEPLNAEHHAELESVEKRYRDDMQIALSAVKDGGRR